MGDDCVLRQRMCRRASSESVRPASASSRKRSTPRTAAAHRHAFPQQAASQTLSRKSEAQYNNHSCLFQHDRNNTRNCPGNLS